VTDSAKHAASAVSLAAIGAAKADRFAIGRGLGAPFAIDSPRGTVEPRTRPRATMAAYTGQLRALDCTRGASIANPSLLLPFRGLYRPGVRRPFERPRSRRRIDARGKYFRRGSRRGRRRRRRRGLRRRRAAVLRQWRMPRRQLSARHVRRLRGTRTVVLPVIQRKFFVPRSQRGVPSALLQSLRRSRRGVLQRRGPTLQRRMLRAQRGGVRVPRRGVDLPSDGRSVRGWFVRQLRERRSTLLQRPGVLGRPPMLGERRLLRAVRRSGSALLPGKHVHGRVLRLSQRDLRGRMCGGRPGLPPSRRSVRGRRLLHQLRRARARVLCAFAEYPARARILLRAAGRLPRALRIASAE
jgi:hypothetical protein